MTTFVIGTTYYVSGYYICNLSDLTIDLDLDLDPLSPPVLIRRGGNENPLLIGLVFKLVSITATHIILKRVFDDDNETDNGVSYEIALARIDNDGLVLTQSV
jgi:hypothetical protein